MGLAAVPDPIAASEFPTVAFALQASGITHFKVNRA